MAHAPTPVLDLDVKSPAELEARRREIITYLQSLPKGYDDPSVPIEVLRELAAVTSFLRRKKAGPPKEARAKPTPASAPKASTDSLKDLL